MIDLSYTRSRLLAEIEAMDFAAGPLSNITDPRVATADAHVRFCGRGRDELFPLLKAALLERFAAVPRLQLIRDLLIPLRNALGNAFKHGNGRDPGKAISVELVLARKGTLVAVTDQGDGFDVGVTFQRFQEQRNYFVNQGAGFTNLHRATSAVTYENGGRTVLICFRPAKNSERVSLSSPADTGDPTAAPGETSRPGHAARQPGSGRREEARASKSEIRNPKSEIDRSLLTSAATISSRLTGGARGFGAAEVFPKRLDADWIQACLSTEPQESGTGRANIEACRIYPISGRANDDCGIRCALRVAGLDGRPETRILTGRLHATEAAAADDFEAATRLREAKISKRVHIPRPVARPAGEPHLVLYDFDSWMNLWEFLTFRNSLKSLRHRAERIGQTLAALHRSQVALRGMETDPLGTGLQATIARAETNLQMLRVGSDVVNRFRVCVHRLQERAASRRRQPPAPIHGAFGWDCIHYGVDGRFYLYRFEACRRSDPGLDLGGFAADLLCFTLAHHDEEVFQTCCDDLLRHYNSETERPMDENDVRFYTALALCERLGRLQSNINAGAELLLVALDATLMREGRPATSEVSS
ncbi:MAG: hypothetical protein DME18_11390 [Verrucomicrobia bacterium]|nr:MAG: hypothetical protein DME18_11390 [Verrucomicrobiota bacterium]